MARFGAKFDAQGVLAGSRDASRCVGYLTKYLTKHVADCHQAQNGAQHDHAERLVQALRYEPCSPRCANWLRYGIQPKNPRPGLRPGYCRGLCRTCDYADTRWRCAVKRQARWASAGGRCRHSYRFSRKARRASGGWYRPARTAVGVVAARARSLMVMSAWM